MYKRVMFYLLLIGVFFAGIIVNDMMHASKSTFIKGILDTAAGKSAAGTTAETPTVEMEGGNGGTGTGSSPIPGPVDNNTATDAASSASIAGPTPMPSAKTVPGQSPDAVSSASTAAPTPKPGVKPKLGQTPDAVSSASTAGSNGPVVKGNSDENELEGEYDD